MTNRTRESVSVLAIAFGALLSATPATADPVAVTNPGFELPAVGNGSFDVDAPPDGWQAYGDSLNFGSRTVGVLNPEDTTLYSEDVPGGSNVGVVFLQPSSGQAAGMQQTLAATLQTNTSYELGVDIGNIDNDATFPHNQFNFSGFPGYRVELLAGSTVIASDDNTLLPPAGGFLRSVLQVSIGATHAAAGQPLTIRLLNLDGAQGLEVNFDEVELDAEAIADCPALDTSSCKAATPLKGSLKLSRRDGDPSASRLSFSWKGDETLAGDLGDPASTSGYRLCLYDGEGDALLGIDAAAGGSCGDKPCWKATMTGYGYRNASGNADGLTALKLKTGTDGKAQIKLAASGSALAMPSLPLAVLPAPATLLLRNLENAACWTASYSTPDSDPASTTRWQAKND